MMTNLLKHLKAAGQVSFCPSVCTSNFVDLTISSSESSDDTEWSHIVSDCQFDKDENYIIPLDRIDKALNHQNAKQQHGSGNDGKNEKQDCHEPTIGLLDLSRGDSDVFSVETQLAGNMNKYSMKGAHRLPQRPLEVLEEKDKYHCSGNDDDSDDQSNESCLSVNSYGDSDILELKMKAHMPAFYIESWVMKFPSYQIPSGIRMSYETDCESRMPKPAFTTHSCWNTEAVELGHPIQLTVDNSSFLDLVLQGSLGLVPDRQRFPSLGMKSYLVLGDRRTGKIVALCSLRLKNGKPVVRIFTTKPRSPQQTASINSKRLGLTKDQSTPLYAWAEFRSEESYPNEETTYFLYSSTGRHNGEFNAKPLFTAIHKFPETSELLEVSQTSKNHGTVICARVFIRTCSKLSKEETYYAMSVSRTTDIVSIICFTAIIDEVMEFAMRKKCAKQSWRHIQ
jgi:hypothetical protein